MMEYPDREHGQVVRDLRSQQRVVCPNFVTDTRVHPNCFLGVDHPRKQQRAGKIDSISDIDWSNLCAPSSFQMKWCVAFWSFVRIN